MLEFDPHIVTPPITWNVMAYYNVAFDESGKAGDSHIVFAGFFDTDVRWSEFGRQWKAKMRPFGIDYFHSKDAFTFGGQWAQFGGHDPERERQRDSLICSLADLILDFPKEAIAQVIDNVAFNTLPSHKREKFRNDPFYAAFDSSMKGLVSNVQVEPDDRFYLICDDTEDYSGECLDMYRRFRRNEPAIAPRFAGICFVDDMSYAPLQLADLYAYILRRKAVGAPDGLWRELYEKYFAELPDKTLGDIIV